MSCYWWPWGTWARNRRLWTALSTIRLLRWSKRRRYFSPFRCTGRMLVLLTILIRIQTRNQFRSLLWAQFSLWRPRCVHHYWIHCPYAHRWPRRLKIRIPLHWNIPCLFISLIPFIRSLSSLLLTMAKPAVIFSV